MMVLLSVPADGAVFPARTRGRPFQSSRRRNPFGRPKGARNRTTLAAQSLIDGDAEDITRKCVELAVSANIPALRLCLKRILPPKRERHVSDDLPDITTAGDAQKASSALLSACVRGALTLGEAMNVMSLISAHSRIIETADLEARVQALEERQNGDA